MIQGSRIRQLEPDDHTQLDAVLAHHPATTMFMRSNLRAAGIVNRPRKRHEAVSDTVGNIVWTIRLCYFAAATYKPIIRHPNSLEGCLFSRGASLMRYLLVLLAVLLGACVADSGDGDGSSDRDRSREVVSFLQPDSAAASSEWSGAYAVEHTIDGSGLPADFGPNDAHADYTQGNHWSAGSNDVEGAWAEFSFAQPVDINTFWMWNHRSTLPLAYSEGYAVTRFDLEFFDASGQSIEMLTDLTAEADVATAQTFTFDTLENVSSVRLIVRANAGEPEVTGLAEVRLGTSR